jgi:hypothetical protein
MEKRVTYKVYYSYKELLIFHDTAKRSTADFIQLLDAFKTVIEFKERKQFSKVFILRMEVDDFDPCVYHISLRAEQGNRGDTTDVFTP